MTFQFTPCSKPEISEFVYEFPPLPYGTSHGLRLLFEAYDKALRDGPDGGEDEPFKAIFSFRANSLSDIAAKVLINLHYEFRAIDGDSGKLVMALGSKDVDTLGNTEALLSDLYSQLPQDWDKALGSYRAALLAEHDYDRRIWTPGYEIGKAGGRGNPASVEEEMERLQDARCNAESLLLEIPAPSLEEFAIKYLICFDNDRDMNGYHEHLCAEAKRLLSIVSDPDGSEVAIILRNLNWRGK